jgi:hypothetical protein
MELQTIQNKIYEIRNMKVMLDRDLAEMYGVETRVINQSVKRNAERFPDDFVFQLNDVDVKNWKSQIVMSNSINMGLRRNPYAFTELGIAMLSSVLKSPAAIQVNINIMRAFVAVRQLAFTYAELKKDLEHLTNSTDERFNDVYLALDELLSQKHLYESRKPIGFV